MSEVNIDNGWREWSRHVLSELTRLNNCYEKLDKDIQELRVAVAMLKVKSGIWGAIGACIPVGIGLAMMFLRGH